MPRHGSNTSPSAPRARISARTSSPLAPHLRCFRLLKAYKPSATHRVTVGVVGFPNVSKSSLINTLKRAKVRHRVCYELEVIVVPLLTARRHEGVCRCSPAGTHKGTAVRSTSTRARPAHRRLAGCHFRRRRSHLGQGVIHAPA